MKNLRKLIIGVVVVLSVIESHAGAVSGGGGGTLPADPVHVWKIEEYSRGALRDLRLYIKYKMRFYEEKTASNLEKKLFGGNKTLWDVLLSTGLELRLDKPCYDAAGNEVDGSIYATSPDDICISAFTIAPKLVEERVQPEVAALMLHELTHLLGADEDEADEFQKEVVFYFRYGKVSQQTAENMADSSWHLSSEIAGQLSELAEKVEVMTYDDIVASLDLINKKMSELQKVSAATPFSLYNKKEFAYEWIMNAQFDVCHWFSQNESSEKHDYLIEKYKDIFGTNKVVNFQEFQQKAYVSQIVDLYLSEPIYKITNKLELKEQLLKISDYYSKESNESFQITYNLTLSKPNLPDQILHNNSWQKFIGDYEVVAKGCVNNGKISNWGDEVTGFRIHYPDYDPSHLRLRKFQKSSWGDHGLFDGASAIWGGSVVSISGDMNSAEYLAEFGTGWGDIVETHKFRLVAVGSDYEMIESHRSRSTKTFNPYNNYTECTYKLIKK